MHFVPHTKETSPMSDTRIAEAEAARRPIPSSLARNLTRLGLAAIIVTGLVGCKSAVKLDEGAPVESRDSASTAAADAANAASRAGSAGQSSLDGRGGMGAGSAGSAGANAAAGNRDPLKDANSPLAKRSIYFDYDSYVVRDEYRSTIDAHARYLTGERSRRVIVQGNTDERGSREYNLALGQKRAEAVRRSLTALGVPDAQVEAVSLGEEKPRATGQDEASFAENRRADLVYP